MVEDRCPKYEILPLKRGGWCVAITPKNGLIGELSGFSTEAHARYWVRKEMNIRALRKT